MAKLLNSFRQKACQRQFHKTLPKFRAFVYWISVRNYETACRWDKKICNEFMVEYNKK